MIAHKPLMSEKEIEKRRAWQEYTYQVMKKINKKYKVKVLGKDFLVLPGVFAPLFGDSQLLAKAVKKETKKNDFVLDLGCGTGIQGIFAAEKALKVMAVDINPNAVKCAKLNIKNQELGNKIKVLKSDLFSNVREIFDLIIFNPPFRWFKPRDALERGELDENYKTLKNFFSEAKKHLKTKGRIILIFSDSGDIKYLKYLIRKNKFKFKILAKQKCYGWWRFVYRLTAL